MTQPTEQLEATPGPVIPEQAAVDPAVRAADRPTDLVADLADLVAGDVDRAGGKGANLGEMVQAGFPVPGGFVVLAASFRSAHRRRAGGGRRAERGRPGRGAGAGVRRHGGPPRRRLPAAAGRRPPGRACPAASPPTSVRRTRAWGRTSRSRCAPRPSARTAATPPTPGMNATFTNVRGADALLGAVVECWASAFTPRVLAYRAEHGKDDLPDIAVVVQLMAPAEKAGVAFTADPVSGRRDRVRRRGRLGAGRGGGQRPHRARHLRARRRRARGCSRSHRGTQTQKIVAAPGGGDRRPARGRAPRPGRCSAARRPSGSPPWCCACRSTTAARRTSSGCSTDGELSLVQTRPITTLADRARPAPDAPRPATRPRCCCTGWPPPRAGRPAGCGCCTPRPRASGCSTARCWSRR